MSIGSDSVVAIGHDKLVSVVDEDRVRVLSESGAVDVSPSVNSQGWVAFVESEPVSRIRLATGDEIRTLHEAGEQFSRFDEVCLNDSGNVAFRATRSDGVEGLYLNRQGTVSAVAEVGDMYTGFRPSFDFNNHDQLAFIARCADGTEVLCIGNDEGLEEVVRSGSYFESLLQVSLNNGGWMAFTARRPGDPIGLPVAGLFLWDGEQVVALPGRGQQLGDSPLEGVLLWRDCLNDAGQLVFLADFGPGRESAILRMETRDGIPAD